MNEYLIRAKGILNRLEVLAACSDSETFIQRSFGKQAFKEASFHVKEWMEEAGMEVRIDNIGNIRGRYTSKDINAKTFVLGSHIDSIVNAGKFDGPLGIVAGLDIVSIFRNAALPFHLELIAFSDEEGARFHSTYLGSKVVAGTFEKTWMERKDEDGITLYDAIKGIGKDPLQIPSDAIPPEHWLGYFEIHIEQGPILYDQLLPTGIVTEIAGQIRSEVTFLGMSGHAGTVPMDKRQDALCCAAEFVLQVEQYAQLSKGNMVATVGKLTLSHAASNVIPGLVTATLDLRSGDKEILSQAYETLKKNTEEICSLRCIHVEWHKIQHSAPVQCDAVLVELLQKSANEAEIKVPLMVSGAGHDAVAIAAVAPVAMLFVRCYKGISHHPLENVTQEDLAYTLRISDIFLKNLITYYT